ncbi:hypothetical protein [Ralstonia solanacearum]|uniref:hypothetical protein n=1 Tax=Ralstonia solanacearum TaxID=305 RepID=UPI0018D094DB|nr:hypothetical protein [Ralstonia solanacearum]
MLDRTRSIGKIKSVYVIHTALGQPYTANGILSAFKRAKKRAGLDALPYNVKDVHAKALTDAANAGYDMEKLRVAAVHTDIKQTEDYVKRRSVPVSEVRMHLPVAPRKSA